MRAAPAHSNQAPKFYADPVTFGNNDEILDDTERISNNETTIYTRYVLENQTRNLTLSDEDARVYDSNPSPDTVEIPIDGVVTVYDTLDDTLETPDPVVSLTRDGTNGNQFLHYSLSGPDAKYFEIPLATVAAELDATPPVLPEMRGVIKTKGPLDFESRGLRPYTVIVTATDPSGATDTVTVTIKVLDVPEIEGLESRIRVDENEQFITSLSTDDPPNVSLGGLKWSLLTTNEDPTNAHNRNDARSIDCQADDMNEGLCDDFRFSNFNSADTTLLFAIGTGEKHDAPNFEDPKDVDDADGTTSTGETYTASGGDESGDNVYKIVVRVAFANLRSQQAAENGEIPANHPNPEADERQDLPVWIRVDDVDEDPKFADDASNRLILENTDDALPTVLINRPVVGTVTASDPEYEYTDGSQFDKKLVYSLSLPEAYAKMFQIVPATGEILTRARVDYEALSELDGNGPRRAGNTG